MAEKLQKREEEIFYQALEKSPGQREAYLAEACGDDQKLYSRIEALLKANDLEDDFLQNPVLDYQITLDNSPVKEVPGAVIGRYKLLEKIGEGGMAVVYMAEQTEPIHRKVALKIIKLGMDTKSVIARFEAERQALAMMDHPNMARVLDAGATETGRPYFVMELVKGVSITEYCDQNSLSTKERLELFIQVCNAVQHAHQKGIIHRDIKPTNVMVTLHDSKPVPKVIDFGIAKAINQKLTEKTLFTRYAHIIGTPAYMSPEQAELSDLDIDTRTDIYSLGVLLYELLTGTTPFGEEELRKAGYIEMQRIIREQEPTKPSTKLSTLSETLTDVAKHHSATPDALRRAVRGDLDWIVMKSLEKDRLRRYESAEGLALDIQRHLEHRPVLARAPSAGYRLRKFLRRNRSPAIAVPAVVLMVVIVVTLSVRNQYQVRLAEAEVVRQVNVLAEARKLIGSGDLRMARKALMPILESEHVGLEARILFANIIVADKEPDDTLKGTEAIMERHYRERAQYYTEKIGANPKDPNNYLQRAQQYHYLHEETKVRADMRRYSIIVAQTASSDFRFATPQNVRRIISGPFGYQLVFSVEERENDIQVPYIAFGQKEKGRCNMKSFQMPMLSMSLLGLCLLSGLDAPCAYADFTVGEPVNVGVTVNSPYMDATPCISADGLELYFCSDRPGGYSLYDLWVTRRPTNDDAWGPPENLGPVVNSLFWAAAPAISADGLELYFHGMLNETSSTGIWMVKRAAKDQPWGAPVKLGPNVNRANLQHCPAISSDGLHLYFELGGDPGDIWVSTRQTLSDPWQPAVDLGPVVNTPYHDSAPHVSIDGLALFFTSMRPGGYGDNDLYVTTRPTIDSPWGYPTNLGPDINTALSEGDSCVSADGRTLYFSDWPTPRPGGVGDVDLWQAPLIPIVDFNGDGQADGKDVLCMASRWSTDDPLCDIGPFAWGDGTVDLQDLIVLAEYIGKEVIDPALIAHWTLDESEGTVAVDSAGGKYGYVLGDAAWQPAGGQVAGALQLDGIDDCVVTSFVLDPSEGPFSVLAWVKGGAPGQVVVSHSQGMGANCLMADAEGRLMTELGSSAGANSALISQTIITDDQWHRIGLVWDGSYRHLYVDGAEVARDAAPLPGLESGEGGVCIGAGNGMETGTFFSGLIDDVRIYNRVVNP